MTFTKVTHEYNNVGGDDLGVPRRPRFDSKNTADRLREGSLPAFSMVSRISKGRKSAFREMGLMSEDEQEQQVEQEELAEHSQQSDDQEPPHQRSYESYEEKAMDEDEKLMEASSGLETEERPSLRPPLTASTTTDSGSSSSRPKRTRWLSRIFPRRKRPRVKPASSAPPAAFAGLNRATMIALLIAVVLPAISYTRGGGHKVEMSGAGAAPTPEWGQSQKRTDSPTVVCKRWAQQCKSTSRYRQRILQATNMTPSCPAQRHHLHLRRGGDDE
jgi:hypothetical protein